MCARVTSLIRLNLFKCQGVGLLGIHGYPDADKAGMVSGINLIKYDHWYAIMCITKKKNTGKLVSTYQFG